MTENCASETPRSNPLDQVDEVLARLKRKGRIYLCLGLTIYVGGSLSLLAVVENKSLAAILQMVLFQIMLIYVFTVEMFPAIRGAFEVGLIANRQMIPTMEGVRSKLDTASALDILAEARKIRMSLEAISDGMYRPITPVLPRPKDGGPTPRPTAPVEVNLSVEDGGGQRSA